jgi:hypothetical protein
MRLHTFKLITALFGLVFGFGYLVFPKLFMSFFGIEADALESFIARFVGGSIIGYFILAWSVRKSDNSHERRAILLSLFFAFLIGFGLCLYGTLSGFFDAFGWIGVAIFGLFAAGYGYFRFSKHSKV